MAFLRLIQKGFAKRFTDVLWKKVEVINPAFPKSAKTDKLLIIFSNPDLALLEDPVPIEPLVAFERMQVGQVWQEMRPRFSRNRRQSIGFIRYRLPE